jgi:peptide/nickel transport system substrate-binding protein
VEARDINQYGNPEYYWRYDDAETQGLLADADAEPDEAASNELYQQVQQRISDQSVNVFLYLLPRLQVVQQGITGFPKNTYSLSYDVTNLRAG